MNKTSKPISVLTLLMNQSFLYLNLSKCMNPNYLCFCVGAWRPAMCWSQQTDRSAWQVCGASSAWSVMAREPKWFTTFPSTASRCCPGWAPRCCSRYYISPQWSIIWYCLFPGWTGFWKCSQVSRLWIVFVRTCRATTPGQTSTASASQPVNWPTDTYPSKTCQLHR